MKRLRTPSSDDGFTLIETAVTLGVMAVVMSIVTGAIIQIHRFVNKTDAIATAQSGLTVAFMRLDKEVRYAAGISTPNAAGDDRYVELLVTNTGTPVCVQLRLRQSSALLSRRSWIKGTTPGAWTTLASGAAGAAPFTVYPADGSPFTSQRLRVNLVVTSGSGRTATAKQTDVTFTALNTSPSTVSGDVCTEGRLVS